MADSMKYYLITDRCTLCGMCVTICPDEAISVGRGGMVIHQGRCTNCGECFENCPDDAIDVFVSDSDLESE